MRILDKYILKELLGPFLFGVCAFTSIFIGTNTLFRIANYITKYGATLSAISRMFIYSLPEIIVLTFPMSMLLASLLTFGRLSASSEITAMKSGGISFYRMAAPVFIVAFALSIATIVFNEKVVPASNAAYNHVVNYEIKKIARPSSQDHIVIKEVKKGNIERLTYARNFNKATGVMQAVTMQEFQQDKLIRLENAEKAIWENNAWVMYNGVVHDLTSEGGITRSLRFNQQIIPLDTKPDSISRQQKDPEEMTIKELKQHIKILKSQFVKASEYETELHQRLTIPLLSFIFAVVGTPLGLQPQRASSSMGFGISIIIIFIYYALMTLTTALGQGGVVPAVIAAWLPNVVVLTVGAVLVRKASR